MNQWNTSEAFILAEEISPDSVWAEIIVSSHEFFGAGVIRVSQARVLNRARQHGLCVGNGDDVKVSRREFIATTAAGAAMLHKDLTVLGNLEEGLRVTIDTKVRGSQISPLIFGAYLEPATTRMWAEMLKDRKFAYSITDYPSTPWHRIDRDGEGEAGKLTNPGDVVQMDTRHPFVGEHSPRVRSRGTGERGIKQSGLHLGRGRSYYGRIYLVGDPQVKVKVRLVWGIAASSAQTITIPPLSPRYAEYPLRFTSAADTDDAHLEIVGTGNGEFRIGTVSLMPADNVRGFHAGMVQLYREQGYKLAKWPGGNFVSTYDWSDGIGERDKRPPRLQPMWNNRVESNDVGIHEFIDFCRLLGAEPYITVNSGFGEARAAAEEVEYCNGSRETRMGRLRVENGHPEPFNVRLWCVGNEMFGSWQFGHMSLRQYWVKHNNFVERMKKADPAIKVTSCGTSICGTSYAAARQHSFSKPSIWRPPLTEKLPYAFGGSQDWDGWLLAKCADNIDFLSEHAYAHPYWIFNDQSQRFEEANEQLQFSTRRLANRIGATFSAWQRYVELMPSLKEREIRFIVDEWGLQLEPSGEDLNRERQILHSLSYALFLHEMFRHSNLVEASCPTYGLGSVLVDKTGAAVGLSSEGLVLKIMASTFAGALPLKVGGNSPPKPISGTPFVDTSPVPTGSPTYPLDVVAALSGDQRSFFLSVVNPTGNSQGFLPQISGLVLHSRGKLRRIALSESRGIERSDENPSIVILDSIQNSLAAEVQVPPFSINIYEFDVISAAESAPV